MNDNKIRNKFTEMSKIFKDVIDEYEILKNQNVMLQEENQGLKEELNIAFFEYDKMKEEIKVLNDKIEKHKEAYSLMCAEKTRRYNELKDEKEKLERKELYDVLDGKKTSKNLILHLDSGGNNSKL
jgi:uncharacterized coiled-coil DUF342 family protein